MHCSVERNIGLRLFCLFRCCQRDYCSERSIYASPASGSRMVPAGSVAGNLTKAMAAKVDTEQGRRNYHRRLAIVEPVFANIEIHKGMNRFTLRSRIKVNIQWILYCMIHNIGKILNYGVRYAFT